MPRWSTTGVESLLRRVIATVLGLVLLGNEAFIHDGAARWPILWAGLALTFGPSVLGLLPRRMDPPAPEPPSLPPSPTGQTGDPS